jgi:membrane-bound serine protease (ClpP class)
MLGKYFFLTFLFVFLFSSIPSVLPESLPDGPVYLIPVKEEIDPFLSIYLKRSILKAKEDNSPLIIFELNTFGGRVDSALEITSLIGSIQWAHTVAYIPSGSEGTGVSWSAGALISFSCDSIYMDSGTSIGAAAPVYQTAEGMVMAEEKVVSAVRGQMAALAEKNGYSRSIALAMVDPDIELFEVKTTEGIRLLTPEDMGELEKGKMVCAEGKLLTLTAGEMEKYGMSSATVSGRESLYDALSITQSSVSILEKTTSDWIVAFLSSAAVASLLIMVGIVALYMEVTSPGFGIPGTIALVCFVLVFISSTLIGNLGSLELLLFLMGIILLLIEVFIIPGFGITGITGIILILVSLVLARQDFVIPEYSWQWDLFRQNLFYVSLSLMGAIPLIAVLMIFLPHSRLFNRLILKETPPVLTEHEPQKHSHITIGEKALALTDLRPVGKAEIRGTVYIVQTEGEYLKMDSPLIVIHNEGLRLVVKRG